MRERQNPVALLVKKLVGREPSSQADDSESPPHRLLPSLDFYRKAIEIAWADGELNSAEKRCLSALENELGLRREQAAEIEREVIGTPAEDVESSLENVPLDTGLRNEAWLKLVEECVDLVDELDGFIDRLDPPRRELTEHMVLRLTEILERCGVEVISDDETFDSRRHMADKASVKVAPGSINAETLSPGFAVGRRVLRRARVRVE